MTRSESEPTTFTGAFRRRQVYKPSTCDSYEKALERYVYPDFGPRKLSNITPLDAQNFSGDCPRGVQKLGSRSESRLGTDIDSFGLP